MAVYTDKIHLIADTEEELHKFAHKIGLKKEWFQSHAFKHYDLMGSKTTDAIRNGAIYRTTKQLIKIYRKANN